MKNNVKHYGWSNSIEHERLSGAYIAMVPKKSRHYWPQYGIVGTSAYSVGITSAFTFMLNNFLTMRTTIEYPSCFSLEKRRSGKVRNRSFIVTI